MEKLLKLNPKNVMKSSNNSYSIVFFGSGPVAAESLRLLAKKFYVEAIITKPTTEREMRAACPSTPLFTASARLDLDKLIEKHDFSSKVAVLVDFGIIVSQKVIDYFDRGIINSHFSLLPELRGADPLSFAILEGKKISGVSLMVLVRGMDEGPLISQTLYALEAEETTPTLTDKLIVQSAKDLAEILPQWIDGSIEAKDQELITIAESKKISYTRKLSKQDGAIDWDKTATQIEREIRAYLGWPKSRTKLAQIDAIITSATILDATGSPGDMFIHEKKLAVYCKRKALIIDTLIPAGKKSMNSTSFLAGYKKRLGL